MGQVQSGLSWVNVEGLWRPKPNGQKDFKWMVQELGIYQS